MEARISDSAVSHDDGKRPRKEHGKVGRDGSSASVSDGNISSYDCAASEGASKREEACEGTEAGGLERRSRESMVVGGGCSGFQYQLALDDEAAAEDQVFEQNGVRFFVDPRSHLYLDGTEIDYVDDIMGSGFKFNNPNATGSCGCGESFQV